jgi:hypothetical protein
MISSLAGSVHQHRNNFITSYYPFCSLSDALFLPHYFNINPLLCIVILYVILTGHIRKQAIELESTNKAYLRYHPMNDHDPNDLRK